MGDLVQSERAPSAIDLHRHFNTAIARANQVHGATLASPLTITLGDEFQGLTKSLTVAAAIARDIRLWLLDDAIECRFVIGLIELTTPLNTSAAWNMMGPGLSTARNKLNQKRAASLYRFSLGELALDKNLEALGAGLTAIERRWTDQQRTDITAFLAGATPNDIAKRRNVSVHSIYKVRSAGDFDAYILQWAAINEALAAIDRCQDVDRRHQPA